MEIFDKRYITFVFFKERESQLCAKKNPSPVFSFNFLRLICRDVCLEETLPFKNVRIEKETKRRLSRKLLVIHLCVDSSSSNRS